MNRGSPLRRETDPTLSSGFNEAPIHESGKCPAQQPPSPYVVASMRPRFMNRGSGAVYDLLFAGREASMRPRFMNRGSDSRHDMIDGQIAASMRPRFMNRGSTDWHRVTVWSVHELQ